jgi:hypothetical protein
MREGIFSIASGNPSTMGSSISVIMKLSPHNIAHAENGSDFELQNW